MRCSPRREDGGSRGRRGGGGAGKGHIRYLSQERERGRPALSPHMILNLEVPRRRAAG